MTENAELAKATIDQNRTASLGTLDSESGGPYVSLVNYAGDGSGLPILLLSRLAWHTKSLIRDPRASLLVAQLPTAGDALAGLRVTLVGKILELPNKELAKLYCRRHPEAQGYVGFTDFSFWRMTPEKVHVIGGFGRIETLAASSVFNGLA